VWRWWVETAKRVSHFGYLWLADTLAARRPRPVSRRQPSAGAGKEGFEVLACDDAAPADLQVGQLP
jgi:hypothetical protein